jgi:hypothetical protein
MKSRENEREIHLNELSAFLFFSLSFCFFILVLNYKVCVGPLFNQWDAWDEKEFIVGAPATIFPSVPFS